MEQARKRCKRDTEKTICTLLNGHIMNTEQIQNEEEKEMEKDTQNIRNKR